MNPHPDRRRLLAIGAMLPVIARAQARGPTEGTEYKLVLPPQPVDSGSKIEVLEFFQYSCPHCFAFNPDLEAWRKKMPADVDYKRIHINWDNSTLNHTKLYYSLVQLGRLEVHDKVFAAIHVNHKRMLDPEEIADLMVANGIDRKQWMDMFNSFSTAALANKAFQTWRAYKIDGTPTLGCDGRYLTSPAMVGARSGSLVVLDYLIQRARTDRGSAKK
ncbi:MAG TPA: thiol:disulfide interchange protein DsbA/DsbL [Burkholderiaceae bacterium]|nr:thiol:disulfide interchange protein DsbA/DsbL [Burkholderiaceae bacterium]